MKKIISILILITLLCGCTDSREDLPAEVIHSPGEEMFVVFPSLEYGFSSLIKTPGDKNILVGCGSKNDFPVLYELLRNRNINYIDTVILPSDNPSNIGGLQNILSNFEVGEVYVGEGFEKISNIRKLCSLNSSDKTELYIAAEGTRIYEEDYLSLDVLSSRICDTPHGKKSAMSMYLVYKDKAVFIEGDGDFVAERDIISTMGNSISADAMCIPHSGQTYLPSEELLGAVNPKYAVIPVYNGNYPLMHLEKSLRANDTEIIRTDTDGNVIFVTDGVNIKYHIQK